MTVHIEETAFSSYFSMSSYNTGMIRDMPELILHYFFEEGELILWIKFKEFNSIQKIQFKVNVNRFAAYIAEKCMNSNESHFMGMKLRP